MALDITTGWTDDGLVFLKMVGQQEDNGRPIETIVTVEPDMAKDIGNKMIEASRRAMFACKRPLIVGQDQKFKRGA